MEERNQEVTLQEDITVCMDCVGTVQENMNGEYECVDCGLIQGQAIDMGKDYFTMVGYLLILVEATRMLSVSPLREISVSDCIVCVCTTNEAEFKRVASATWCKPCMNFSDWPATWD